MKATVPDTGDAVTNALLETAFHEGVDKARNEVLTFLEQKYMAQPYHIQTPEKTPMEKAILEVTKELGIFIRAQMNK